MLVCLVLHHIYPHIIASCRSSVLSKWLNESRSPTSRMLSAIAVLLVVGILTGLLTSLLLELLIKAIKNTPTELLDGE